MWRSMSPDIAHVWKKSGQETGTGNGPEGRAGEISRNVKKREKTEPAKK